jgi:hypothetical protein
MKRGFFFPERFGQVPDPENRNTAFPVLFLQEAGRKPTTEKYIPTGWYRQFYLQFVSSLGQFIEL